MPNMNTNGGDGGAHSDMDQHTRMLREVMGNRGTEPPFELRVLEVALDVVSAHLEYLAQQLDGQAQAALDNLTRQVWPFSWHALPICASLARCGLSCQALPGRGIVLIIYADMLAVLGLGSGER